MNMIETQGLTRRFDDVLAVDDLSLEIAKGEIFGLLGPNGAGKTTTVRMLSCLISADQGTATVGGYTVGPNNTAIRQAIGLLTESPGLYEKLDAYTNLAFYAKLYGVQEVNRQMESYLCLLGLWGRHQEPVGRFSKGMKQKLAIARALVHEPQVLFLDEPTAGLDPEAARVVRDFIKDLKAQGRTILLCTHNLDEAERLCDRIGVLKTRLVALDTPDQLRSRVFGRQSLIRLRQVTHQIVAAVREIDGVSRVAQQDNQLLITLNDPDNDHPRIVRRLVEMGGEVQEVSERKHSLEDTYLSLVQEA